MIRVLFGSALSFLGLGAAVAILTPNLVTGPRGEPMIMAGPGQATLQAASFDGGACAPTLLFAGPLGAGDAAGAHIIAFALRTGARGVAIEVKDFPGATQKSNTVVLIFDEAGRLVSVGDPESLHAQARAKIGIDCETQETRAPI